jgi:uncharacterized repeat protein (TIGR04076 family)
VHKLKITVERIDGYCNQSVLVGDSFTVEDNGMLKIPERKRVCLWALQSMGPMFPLLQQTDPQKGDKDSHVFVCPDPKGLVHYRIERIGKS